MASLFDYFANPFGISDVVGEGLSRVTGQRETFDYQKKLNNLTMQREDNAFQRAVADAEKAGLSPLSVSSGASASSMQSASLDNSGALSFGSGLLGMVLDYKNKKKSLDIADKQADIAQTKANADMYNDSLLTEAQLGYLRAQKDALEKSTYWNEKNGWRNLTPMGLLTNLGSDALHGDLKLPVLSWLGDNIGAGLRFVGSKVVPNTKVDSKSEFVPRGFATSNETAWTVKELEKLQNAGIPISRLPNKQAYYRIAKEDGADKANAWLRSFVRGYESAKSFKSYLQTPAKSLDWRFK